MTALLEDAIIESMSGNDERISFFSVKKKYYVYAISCFLLIWYVYFAYLLFCATRDEKDDVIVWFIKNMSIAIPVAYAIAHSIIEIGGYFVYSWEVWRDRREDRKQQERKEIERQYEEANRERWIEEGRKQAESEMSDPDPLSRNKDSEEDN